MPAIPTLDTERLTLRAPTMADFPSFAEACANERFRYVGGPMDARFAWGAFCRDVAQWALLGHGAWTVTERGDDAAVGQVGLSQHPYFPELELGWMVLDGYEGKSIAFEAAKAAKSWALHSLNPKSLVSYIHTGNARSIALAERLGARIDPDAALPPYKDHVAYRHPIGGTL
ncbi:MAG: GNAT family N-acetyltransferase [Pseudomonadota bacterium]